MHATSAAIIDCAFPSIVDDTHKLYPPAQVVELGLLGLGVKPLKCVAWSPSGLEAFAIFVEGVRYAPHGIRVLVIGPLPIVTSASLVSVPNPHLCAYILEYSCASSMCALVCHLVFYLSHTRAHVPFSVYIRLGALLHSLLTIHVLPISAFPHFP